MATLSIVDAVKDALDREMANDKTIMVMGEDVGVDGGVFRATDGLLKKYGKQRVVDTPLSELGIVGTAIGLAMNGMKPVCEIQFSGFIYPAFQQITSHVARIRNRSRGTFTCPLVIRAPYGGGIRALEHHSESMEALFAHVQGLKVVIPGTPYDAKGLLIAAIRDPDPVLFLEPKKIYRAFKQEIPDEAYIVDIGKAEVVQEGTDCTIVAYGAMRHEVTKAMEIVEHSCEVIDLKTIFPLDTETIKKSVEKTGRLVVVHEGPRTCGMGAEISARMMEKALLSLKAPVKRVTGYDVVFPLAKLEDYYIPNPEKIKMAVDEVMNF